MEDKQRYLRLQLLLDKSEIYCKFLQERMEKQRVDAQKHQERMAKKEEKQKRQDANSTQRVWEQFLFFTLFLYLIKLVILTDLSDRDLYSTKLIVKLLCKRALFLWLQEDTSSLP